MPLDLEDVKKTVRDKVRGLADFAAGSEVLSRLAGNNRSVGAPAAPPSADFAKKLAMMAEEQARRNGVKPKVPMTPAAKKALGTK